MPTLIAYTPLESSFTSALATIPTFSGDTSLYTVSVYVYTLFFVAIVGAAFYRYVLAGIWRMEASETGIKKSNETIKKTTLGLLGVFSLFLILYTVNKGMLTGDVDLAGLGSSGVASADTNTSSPETQTNPGTQTGSQPNTNNTTCTGVTAESVKAKLGSSSGICTGTSCTVLSGCSRQYFDLVKQLATAKGFDYKIVTVVMCKESGGKIPPKNNTNTNGTQDCGLMQINRSGGCLASDNDPTSNINDAIEILKKKQSVMNNVTQGIPPEAKLFASYNCCGNDPPPNNTSSDCTNSNGFPSNFPRWACPINPGQMCPVQNYACELVSCLSQVP